METPFGHIPDRLARGMGPQDVHEFFARPSRRRFLQGAAATTGVLAVSPTLLAATGSAAGAPPMSPRLTLGTDQSTSMSVSWSTPGAVSTPRLDLGRDGSFGSTFEAETRVIGGAPTVPTNYHHVRLTGLEPGTTYQYRLSHAGSEALEGLTFTTAPATPVPFTFTAFGDQGTYGPASLVTGLIAAIKPDLHLVAGDHCYANDLGSTYRLLDFFAGQFEPAVWDQWFLQNNASMAVTPWMASMGNHDIEPGLGVHGYAGHDARQSLPQDGFNSYVYDFRYGNVAFVSLDANDVSLELPHPYTEGAQTAWLDGKLGALRADPTVDFIVCYFHHCAYCTLDSHGSDGGVRDLWVPLFDKHGVDLVINGHNHGYERTTPIRGNVPTVEAPIGATVRSDQAGTTYICAGGGGKTSHDFAPAYISRVPLAHQLGLGEPEGSPWSTTRVHGYSFLRADVTPPDASGVTTMALTAIDTTGAVVDSVNLQRQRAVAPAPSTPVPPAEPEAPAADEPTQVAAGGANRGATGDRELADTGGTDLLLPAVLVGAAAVGAASVARRAKATDTAE